MKLKGKIESYNFSPKGGYEGMLLNTREGIMQLNFSPEHASQIVESAPPGSAVTATVSDWDDHRSGDHPVYQLESLALEKGKPIELDRTVSVKGAVQRFNFAKHGEPNGVLLDTGDFVHLKPHGVKLIQPELGQKLTVKGSARRLQFGDQLVIEAESVDGVSIHDGDKKKPKKKPGR